MEEKVTKCSVSKKCGSCQDQGVPYKEQLAAKQKKMKKLLGKFANVKPIIGMMIPFIIEIKFMQYLTGIKKVILSVEPMRQKHIRLFR